MLRVRSKDPVCGGGTKQEIRHVCMFVVFHCIGQERSLYSEMLREMWLVRNRQFEA